MSWKLHRGGFKWIEKTCHFKEDFIKTCNEDNDLEYFL